MLNFQKRIHFPKPTSASAKFYHIFDICSTTFRQYLQHLQQDFLLLAYGSLYRFLTSHKWCLLIFWIYKSVPADCSYPLLFASHSTHETLRFWVAFWGYMHHLDGKSIEYEISQLYQNIDSEHTCAVTGYKYQPFHKKVADYLQNAEYSFLYYCRSTPPKSNSTP